MSLNMTSNKKTIKISQLQKNWTKLSLTEERFSNDLRWLKTIARLSKTRRTAISKKNHQKARFNQMDKSTQAQTLPWKCSEVSRKTGALWRCTVMTLHRYDVAGNGSKILRNRNSVKYVWISKAFTTYNS